MARIAFLIPNLGGGGAERVALTLTAAFVERGHEVDLLVMQRRGELIDLVPAGVRLVDLGALRTRNVLRPLIRYLRERRPDALQVSMWPLTVIGILAGWLSRVPVRLVVSDHAVLSSHYPRSKHRLIGASIRLFYPLAAGRVTVSNGAADDISRLSGLPRRSIEVIPNPIGLPHVDRERSGAGGKRILTVGNLKPEKNHALLIRAFAKLPTQLDAQLIIAGDGSLREELVRLAEREGVADRVVFTGYVKDVWPLYVSADLFALSSVQESFGNVLVEALHAGLPIVSTDTVGAREILEGGKHGALVDPGNVEAFTLAMEHAILTPGSVEESKRRAIDLSGKNSIDLYEALLLSEQSRQSLS